MTNIATFGLSAAAFLALLLGGCAWVSGSVVELEGTVCGQPVKLRVADNKDRSGFDATVTCGADGGVTLTTTDSSASAVMAAQAEAIRGLAAEVGKLP